MSIKGDAKTLIKNLNSHSRINYLKNSQGSIILALAITLIAFTLLFSLHIEKSKTSYFNMRTRAKHYLCLKNIYKEMNSYVHWMGSFNTSIAAAFLTLPEGKAAYDALILAQSVLHYKYLSLNFLRLKHCRVQDKIQVINQSPYKGENTTQLTRLPNGVAILRRRQCTISIMPEEHARFILKANFTFRSSFSRRADFSSREYSLALKSLSGL